MKERGLIFTGESVQAFLAGRKTQTRRFIKPQPVHVEDYQGEGPGLLQRWSSGRFYFAHDPYRRLVCPYGEAGDRIWVKEAWRIAAWRTNEEKFAIDYQASPELVRTPWTFPNDPSVFGRLLGQSQVEALNAARAGSGSTKELPGGHFHWEHGDSPCRWRNSRYMPRWASRLTFDVVEARVERLQDISHEDAIAEGTLHWVEGLKQQADYDSDSNLGAYPVTAYKRLWDRLNAKRGCAWAQNPWVWVLTLQPVEPGP